MKRKARRQLKAERLAAFEALVSEYEGKLLRYASRLLLNDDTAQDVVQNTFLRLFRKWKGELCPSSRLSSWLYRVAHNCAVDHVRKETRRRDLHMKHAEEREDYVLPNRGEGFQISENAEMAAAALRKLSLREQQLVILKVYEEKSYKEISEITELTTSNIGFILHFAMKKMAANLQENRTADAGNPSPAGNSRTAARKNNGEQRK